MLRRSGVRSRCSCAARCSRSAMLHQSEHCLARRAMARCSMSSIHSNRGSSRSGERWKTGRLLARGAIVAAVACLRAATAAAPMEPDYHAGLGWALWCLRRTVEAADEARPHLSRALAIKPDHAIAHEYIGRIDAALGTDDVQ